MKRKPETWMVARAIAYYYYNVSSYDWAIEFQKRIGSNWALPYLNEALEKYQHGFQSHFGELDFERQQIMLDMILDRYQQAVTDEFKVVSDTYLPCEDCGSPTLTPAQYHAKCGTCTAARERYLEKGE